MIGSLRGEVLERWNDGTVLVDVGGVGYEVTVSPRAFGELEPTTSAFLYIHHHIREDGQTLYGFLSRDERTTFKTLIATHGVGPALALAILATYPPAALVDVVANGDVGALKAVPGVGPKTAERLLVELRDRLSVPVLDGNGGGSNAGAATSTSTVGAVREALAGLGYGADEIRDAVRELPGEGDAATLLRDALKLLGARRA
jgi:Holliday junction DNA helicase RuvA